jgi:hypothetical protein
VHPAGTPLTRRSFVAAMAAGAVMVATPLRAWAGGGGDALSRSTFAPALGEDFTLTGPAGTVHSTLDEIGDLVGAPAGAERRFSLLFRAPSTAGALDGVYTVANRRLGSRSLFLVPVDRGAVARLYQAVVNRA